MTATLFIIAAPSGAGKTTLVKALVESIDNVVISVSHTTRPMRPGEQEGLDYHFVNHDSFEQMVERGEFLEHATVFGNCYGTSRQWLLETLRKGKDVILEIDWQGARQIRNALDETLSICILPPSRATLEHRLRGRGTDGEEVIARRMRDAVNEMSHYNEADYLIVNDHFQTALSELKVIVGSTRLRLVPQAEKHKKLLADLLR